MPITDRLILRPWRKEDRVPYAALNADPRVMEFFPCCLTREESDWSADRIELHFARHGWGPWAVERRECPGFIGFVGLCWVNFESHFTPAVEVAWRLAAEAWGQGYATEAAREAVRYGFEVAGLEEIVALTVPANVRSRRVMEKIGMVEDVAGGFDHPRLDAGHRLRRHVLYRMRRQVRCAAGGD